MSYRVRLGLVALLLQGCASVGIPEGSDGRPVDVVPLFERGEVRLTCGISCAGTFGAANRPLKLLHDHARWKELAIEVIRIGFTSDLGYYYLARAAEKMGYPRSAYTYYLLAHSNRYKCDGINCAGIRVVEEARAGIERLAPRRPEPSSR